MKTIKWILSVVAASQMSISNIAFAGSGVMAPPLHFVNGDQTFAELYQENYSLMGAQNRALFSPWLKDFGDEKLPAFTTERSRSETGADLLTLTGTQWGKTYTFTLSSANPDSIDINGKKVSTAQFQRAKEMLALVEESETEMALPFQNWDQASLLTSAQFMKLSPAEKVAFLQTLRQAMEAAEAVYKKPAAKRTQSSFIQELVFGQLAFAESMSLPPEGGPCIVAGNGGRYQVTKVGLSCMPVYDEVGLKAKASCSGAKAVACNPLVYGLSDSGTPYCLDSTNRAQFTSSATAQCNEKSPLAGEPGSDARNKSYERILKSYFLAKNGTDKANDIAACFAADSKVKASSNCEKWFSDQINGFKTFITSTLNACDSEGMKSMVDQQSACSSLRQRALELSTYSDGLRGLAAIGVVEKEQKVAQEKVIKRTEDKKKCGKDSKGNKESKNECKKGGWWVLLAGVGIFALLLSKHKKSPAKPDVRTPASIPAGIPIPRVVTAPLSLSANEDDVCSPFKPCYGIPTTPPRAAARP